MARGNRRTRPMPWADSGPLLTTPRHAHPHDSANNRKLFLLHERNFMAMQGLEPSEHQKAEHEDLAELMRRFFTNPAIPLRQRVRMASSIGAVMGVSMGAGELSADVPTAELTSLVRDTVHDLMEPTRAGDPRADASRP
jgi:hypothetical protein